MHHSRDPPRMLRIFAVSSQRGVLLLLRPSALQASGSNDIHMLVATRTAKSASHSTTSKVLTRRHHFYTGKRYDSTATPTPDPSCGRLTATTGFGLGIFHTVKASMACCRRADIRALRDRLVPANKDAVIFPITREAPPSKQRPRASYLWAQATPSC